MYVDGFNLFYGMRAKGWRRYYWLDLQKLAENLLRNDQNLRMIRYFTANLFDDTDDAGKAIRQATYLEALKTLSDAFLSTTDISSHKRSSAANAETSGEPSRKR